MHYPIDPLTASLLAGGWKIKEAIQFHADPEIEAIDDELAIEIAFENGWNGVDGLDEILGSFMGNKWAVLTVMLRNSDKIIGGSPYALAKITLDTLRSRSVSLEFAFAAKQANYCLKASPLEREIRTLAEQHLEHKVVG